MPGSFTVGDKVVPPATMFVPAVKPFQTVEKLVAGLLTVAERLTVCAAQVKTGGGAMTTVGASVSAVTTTKSEAVQPLARLVTVKVKVPAWLMVGAKLEPPSRMPEPLADVQTVVKLGFPVAEAEPCKLTCRLSQVIFLSTPALAAGGSMSLVTVSQVVELQPFTVLIAVKQYVPMAPTVGFKVVPPEIKLPFVVDQTTVTFGSLEEPLSMVCNFWQVNFSGEAMAMFGALESFKIVTTSLAVQPFVSSVTTKL